MPLVQCLLARRADVSAQNARADTPLHYAYLSGDIAIIRYPPTVNGSLLCLTCGRTCALGAINSRPKSILQATTTGQTALGLTNEKGHTPTDLQPLSARPILQASGVLPRTNISSNQAGFHLSAGAHEQHSNIIPHCHMDKQPQVFDDGSLREYTDENSVESGCDETTADERTKAVEWKPNAMRSFFFVMHQQVPGADGQGIDSILSLPLEIQLHVQLLLLHSAEGTVS